MSVKFARAMGQLPKYVAVRTTHGLRNSLTSDNAKPLNLRSGVLQTVVGKRSGVLSTPDDHARQSAGLSFQGRQIAYSAFIVPAAVVYYEDILQTRRSLMGGATRRGNSRGRQASATKGVESSEKRLISCWLVTQFSFGSGMCCWRIENDGQGRRSGPNWNVPGTKFLSSYAGDITHESPTNHQSSWLHGFLRKHVGTLSYLSF